MTAHHQTDCRASIPEMNSTASTNTETIETTAELVAKKEPAPAKFGALQSRNFRLLWLGLFISYVGTWMSLTAEGWLVTSLEPDSAPLWLGAISAAFAVPMILLPAIGGAVADRVDRMRMLWITQAAFLFLSLVIAWLAITDRLNVWGLVAASSGMGVILAFDSPARHALLPDLVPRSDLTSAVSLNAVVFTGAALVGPAAAGLLIPVAGTSGVFVVRAVASAGPLIALAMMTGVPQRAHAVTTEGVWQSILSGARYLWLDPMMRGLILLSLATAMLGRSFTPLLAVYARDEFGVGSRAFGALVAAGGLGTLAGSLFLASRGSVNDKGTKILVAAVLNAIALLGLALTPWFLPAISLQIMIGISGAIIGALIATLLQMNAPPDLRGRIMSLYMLTIIGAPTLGALVAGVAADQTSVRIAMGASATLLLLALVFIGRNYQAVRSVE